MENESEASIQVEGKKGGQLRWTKAMDTVLIDMLVDAAREGKKSGNKWQSSVWTSLIATLSKKTNEVVQSSHIENRMRQMKIEYRNFMELKEKSGVAYDSVKQTVDMSDDYWNDLLKLPKGKEKFKAFRDRGIKWDLEKLAIIIGNSQATGSCSLNGLDDEKADVQEGKDKGQLVIELDEEESISCTSTKKRQVPSLKRQHGKKGRIMEEMMNGIFEGVNERLDKLTDVVNPFSFGKELRQSVMAVQGFNEKFLNWAFRYLMKDKVEAEIFVLTNEEGKRDILNDLWKKNL